MDDEPVLFGNLLELIRTLICILIAHILLSVYGRQGRRHPSQSWGLQFSATFKNLKIDFEQN